MYQLVLLELGFFKTFKINQEGNQSLILLLFIKFKEIFYCILFSFSTSLSFYLLNNTTYAQSIKYKNEYLKPNLTIHLLKSILLEHVINTSRERQRHMTLERFSS
jgi:hypothetical protein